jgi:3-phosphoglycerate kinase
LNVPLLNGEVTDDERIVRGDELKQPMATLLERDVTLQAR